MFRCVPAGAAALMLLAAGCGGRDAVKPAVQVKMGETATLGPLAYTVTEAEWMDQLGNRGAADARLPQNRFLAIRMSVTNGGARTYAIPNAELIDSRGESHPELMDASGLPDWFGALRTVEPAQTEHGRIIFDVPIGTYKLKITEDAEDGRAQSALIELPFQPTSLLPGQKDERLPGAAH